MPTAPSSWRRGRSCTRASATRSRAPTCARPTSVDRSEMNLKWKNLGGQAGIGLAALGFLLIFLGWNGAATYDREPAQLPYVISGGLAGLAVVVVAAALMVVNAQRQDRAALLNGLAELKEAMERMALAAAGGGAANGSSTQARLAVAEEEGLVVAGPTTFH